MIKLFLGAIIGGAAASILLNNNNLIVSKQDYHDRQNQCEAIAKQLAIADSVIAKEVQPKVKALYHSYLQQLQDEEAISK